MVCFVGCWDIGSYAVLNANDTDLQGSRHAVRNAVTQDRQGLGRQFEMLRCRYAVVRCAA